MPYEQFQPIVTPLMNVLHDLFLWVDRRGTRLEHNPRHLARTCWAFIPGENCETVGPLAQQSERKKTGRNRLKYDEKLAE